MKGIIKLCLGLLISISTSAFATRYCPATIVVHDGNYTAPAGWHVISIEIMKNTTFEVPFFQAEYNYSWKTGQTTNNRIGCRYSENEYAEIEIITDNPYPMPKAHGTHSWMYWNTTQSKVCGLAYFVTTEECPWDEG